MPMAVIKVNKKKNIYMGLDGLHLFCTWFQRFEILHRFVFGLQQIARNTKVVIYKVVQ